MQETPDISKIVSVIMQNPALISQIASLVNTNAQSVDDGASDEAELKEVQTQSAETVQTVQEAPTHNRARRKELLNAMKPYLSEHRRGAVDSMSSILDILDVMVKKEM